MPITTADLDRVAELLTLSEDERENRSKLFALWAEQGELACESLSILDAGLWNDVPPAFLSPQRLD
jgi:hypothetical protein